MKVVITNDKHPQSSTGVALVPATSLSPADQPGTKTCSLVTWMLIPPQIPHGKLMHLPYMQTLEGVLCPRFRLPPAQPVCAASGISRHSRAQLNTGTSLIKSLLKIMHMHMLFLIILRNLPSGLPPWTATQQWHRTAQNMSITAIAASTQILLPLEIFAPSEILWNISTTCISLHWYSGVEGVPPFPELEMWIVLSQKSKLQVNAQFAHL